MAELGPIPRSVRLPNECSFFLLCQSSLFEAPLISLLASPSRFRALVLSGLFRAVFKAILIYGIPLPSPPSHALIHHLGVNWGVEFLHTHSTISQSTQCLYPGRRSPILQHWSLSMVLVCIAPVPKAQLEHLGPWIWCRNLVSSLLHNWPWESLLTF